MLDRTIPYLIGIGEGYPHRKDLLVTMPPQEKYIRYQHRGIAIDEFFLKIPQTVWTIGVIKREDHTITPAGKLVKAKVESLFFTKIPPLNEKNRGLHIVPLPNVYVEGGVCSDWIPIDGNYSVVNIINEAIAAFWDQPFNPDIRTGIERCFKTYEVSIALRQWETETVFPWRQNRRMRNVRMLKSLHKSSGFAPIPLHSDICKEDLFCLNGKNFKESFQIQ